MYIFNMVQHLKSGEVVAPALTYATNDEWKAKYHQEWSSAHANKDCDGLSVLVTDMKLNKVFEDNWVREPLPEA